MSTVPELVAQSGLELLSCGTPSGYKISIMLEELKEAYGKDYTLHPIDLSQNVQKQPWFTTLGPNGRIPVLVDHDKGGLAIMEGQAILQYLARWYDAEHKFSYADEPEKSICEQWIGFGQSHVGPYTAECVFFNRFASDHDPFAIQHFVGELERLYGVLNARLKDHDYLVGSTYSIADIALFAVIDVGPTAGIDRGQFPYLERWWDNVSERPAVRKGSTVPFPNPVLGATYQQRLLADVEFEQTERELFHAVAKAKERYGYKYSCP